MRRCNGHAAPFSQRDTGKKKKRLLGVVGMVYEYYRWVMFITDGLCLFNLWVHLVFSLNSCLHYVQVSTYYS